MYGKVGLASGAVATGVLLATGMRLMTYVIAGGFVLVLAGITLYRLATIKARR